MTLIAADPDVIFSASKLCRENLKFNGKYLFCYVISKPSLFCYAANRFGPYYAMHGTSCDSTSKHLIPLIFSHILKYYLVPNKTSTFYYRL
jgi:hypothetical protein